MSQDTRRRTASGDGRSTRLRGIAPIGGRNNRNQLIYIVGDNRLGDEGNVQGRSNNRHDGELANRTVAGVVRCVFVRGMIAIVMAATMQPVERGSDHGPAHEQHEQHGADYLAHSPGHKSQPTKTALTMAGTRRAVKKRGPTEEIPCDGSFIPIPAHSLRDTTVHANAIHGRAWHGMDAEGHQGKPRSGVRNTLPA